MACEGRVGRDVDHDGWITMDRDEMEANNAEINLSSGHFSRTGLV